MLRFHKIHNEQVKLSVQRTVAQGRYGLVFTEAPLIPGQTYKFKVSDAGNEKFAKLWLWVTGFTPEAWDKIKPRKLLAEMEKTWGVDTQKAEIYIDGEGEKKSKTWEKAFGSDYKLKSGDIVGMTLHRNRSLSVSINDTEVSALITRLPDGTLYGAIRMGVEKIEIIETSTYNKTFAVCIGKDTLILIVNGNKAYCKLHTYPHISEEEVVDTSEYFEAFVIMAQSAKDESNAFFQCCLYSEYAVKLKEMAKEGFTKTCEALTTGRMQVRDNQNIKLSFRKESEIYFDGGEEVKIKFRKDGQGRRNLLMKRRNPKESVSKAQLQITTWTDHEEIEESLVITILQKPSEEGKSDVSKTDAIEKLRSLALGLKSETGLKDKWSFVARHLGLLEADIMELRKCGAFPVVEMVNKWIEQQGHRASISLFRDALKKEKLGAAIDILDRKQ